MKKIIEAKEVVKTYGKDQEKVIALNGVNIDVYAGEFLSIMGPSGSGKTTLMFALSGMDNIDSGSIQFGGRELDRMDDVQLADMRRREMGFVFQQPTMLKNLNILDNIIFPSMRDGRKDLMKLNQKAVQLMKETGISGFEKRNITQVSGGQLQRAGICRALINTPKVVFGDEPTGALNSKSAGEIMELLLKINAGGTAVFLVTHDPKIAAHCQRVLFMRDGNIVSELELGQYTGKSLEHRMKLVSSKMQNIEG